MPRPPSPKHAVAAPAMIDNATCANRDTPSCLPFLVDNPIYYALSLSNAHLSALLVTSTFFPRGAHTSGHACTNTPATMRRDTPKPGSQPRSSLSLTPFAAQKATTPPLLAPRPRHKIPATSGPQNRHDLVTRTPEEFPPAPSHQTSDDCPYDAMRTVWRQPPFKRTIRHVKGRSARRRPTLRHRPRPPAQRCPRLTQVRTFLRSCLSSISGLFLL